jgi:hypothetical protein
MSTTVIFFYFSLLSITFITENNELFHDIVMIIYTTQYDSSTKFDLQLEKKDKFGYG